MPHFLNLSNTLWMHYNIQVVVVVARESHDPLGDGGMDYASKLCGNFPFSMDRNSKSQNLWNWFETLNNKVEGNSTHHSYS